ncbi:MAG: TetR/AcrR family transcriptional regulator [Gordonia sp. (in: high G+C Gram-positive bacteria)]|uniref:TetR/AcrR family transcriptional regulator n=1 Tax=Gordonia TaxID=2053 RepID=UPI00326668FF
MTEREEGRTDSVRDDLANAAYRLIAVDGVEALTVRRLAQEAGTSTMAVYTRFGSLGAVAGEVCERGFAELGTELSACGASDDPLADLMHQGLRYLQFATSHPRLYTLMFQYTSPDWPSAQRMPLLQHGAPTDSVAGRAAFSTMVGAVRAASAATIDDATLLIRAGVVWSTVHGLSMLSIAGHLTGAHDLVARDGLITLAVGHGADRPDAEAAFAEAELRMNRPPLTPAAR